MAIHDNHFYHKTIANTTAAIGTIFDNLSIKRFDKDGNLLKSFRVPLEYGEQEWWYKKIEKSKKNADVETAHSLPMITYVFNEVDVDMSRQTSRFNKIKSDSYEVNGEQVKDWQFMGTPIRALYTFSIMTKYIDDSLQLVEQLLPYFDPDINIKIRNVDATCAINDVKVRLANTPSMTDNTLEGFEAPRRIVWEFNIIADTFLYKPVNQQKVIRTVIVDIDNLNPKYDIETLTVEAHPDENSDKDNSTITVEIGK